MLTQNGYMCWPSLATEGASAPPNTVACAPSLCSLTCTCRCSATLWKQSLVSRRTQSLGQGQKHQLSLYSQNLPSTPHHVTEPWAKHSFYITGSLRAHKKLRGLMWGRKRLCLLDTWRLPYVCRTKHTSHVRLESPGKRWATMHTGKNEGVGGWYKLSCIQNPSSTISIWIHSTEELEGSELCQTLSEM